MKYHENNSSHRILVIDDNAAIHEDFRKILVKKNMPGHDLQKMESAIFGLQPTAMAPAVFDIDCASQGKEGLDMVREARSAGRPYALAFVDGRMPPGWDGIETISHLWREAPDLQAVLCTAYADYSWHEIRNVLGESDSLLILKKPFDNVEVLQLAHALTRKWDLSREVERRIENLDDLVRKRTDEKERTTALLEAALAHSPAGIVILDVKEAKIRWANPAAWDICNPACLFPSETRTAAGHNEWRVLRIDGSPCPDAEMPLFRATLKGEIIRNEEILLRDAMGRDKWISSNAGPIRNSDGAIVAAILISQDITERKQAEKEREKLHAQLNQSQKLESVGLLAGGVAHDFNNMMGVILGHTELGMMDTRPTEPIYGTLKIIQNSARRSAELTKQLLTFARKQPIAPKVLNLNHNVANTLNMLQQLIGEDIDLLWKPGEGLWPIRVDPSQIDQILVNLCVNARDAIAGVGKLTIETQNTVFDESYCAFHSGVVRGQYVMLAVSDDGEGIEKEILDHIFEPFFTTKEVGMGSGLGLSTVYGIVKQNDGFINVYSEPGKGATFKAYLPRFLGESESARAPEAAPQAQRGQGEMVLLVEDEKDILNLIKTMLDKLEYTVLTARTPGEAFQQVETHGREIKLLLTDVVMPEMNGRDLAKKLTSIHPDLKYLFMSGYTANVIAHRGVLEEEMHFIQKPFSMKDFAAKLREVLDR